MRKFFVQAWEHQRGRLQDRTEYYPKRVSSILSAERCAVTILTLLSKYSHLRQIQHVTVLVHTYTSALTR